jgi:class 3 adenylate cyclase/tetratricopeptide (TPR) repeat protein
MKCPKCQRENPEDARFCNGCGHNLTIPSQPSPEDLSFDEKIDKIQRYLPKGLTEKILSQKDRIEGEKKQVTVMFCDMEGFTTMVERLGPEKAYTVMDQVYEILIHKVHDFDGTVNEMTGDGIMALFGAPIALENAPQRTLRSALSIHNEIAKFNDQNRDINPIKMRMGVHTGPVVVGTLGNSLRVEFKAVGDTVNLASRMEGLAEPGSTCVTEETFRLTEGLFHFESLGPKAVKGKEAPVPVYRLVSAKTDDFRPRLGAERMIYSEIVGRDKDLDKLELQAMKTVNGEGSIVNITGEAGIGKSRLIAELKGRDVIKKVVLLEGRAIDTGRNLSFYPIISLLKHWARIKEGDAEAAAFGKLENALRNVCPDDLMEILPFIATLMGMKFTGRYAKIIEGIEGEALQKNILKNMKDFLTKATELTPLVIVMEDLHWADTSSIELLESLYRLSETRRVLFVNVFRPGYQETSDRVIETLKERPSTHSVEISLKPLGEQESETLINNMLHVKGLHHAVKDKIIKRSGGNPFFIEEVVRSFIDEGAVVKKKGGFEVTDKINAMVVPLTISDVLMARIDRLEDETRNLVKVASVIGRSFFYRILSEVAATTDDMDSRLDHLKTIQLIRERRRVEEIEYLFKHALAQEAAYESILVQKRKAIHLKVAQSVETIFKERLREFYGMLAFHYSKGEDEEKTEEYLIKAGEEALKSSGSSEALHYYQEALDLYLKKYGDTADSEKVAMIRKNIAYAHYNRGQLGNALEYFDKVLAFYGVKANRVSVSGLFKLLYRFLYLLAALYTPFIRGKKPPSDRDREIIRLIYDRDECLSVLDVKRFFFEYIINSNRFIPLDLSNVRKGPGKFLGLSALFSYGGISFRLSRKILLLFKEKVKRSDPLFVLLYKLCTVIHGYFSGDWEFADQYDDDLVNRNLKAIGVVLPGYVMLHADSRLETGSYAGAEELVTKLAEIGNAYEHAFSFAHKYHENAHLLMKWRKIRDALIEAEEAIRFIHKTAHDVHLFSLYSIKARILILMGDIERAEKNLQHANEIEKEISPAPLFLYDYSLSHFILNLHRLAHPVNSGDARDVADNKTKALKAGKRAVKNSRKVAFSKTETYKLMGVYYWLIGKQRKALKWWRKSIFAGERLNGRLELSRTYFEVGKRLLEPGSKHKSLNGMKAEEYLEKARTMFEEMDLQWDLDQLDRIGAYSRGK